jgi:acetyl esterase/lipase
MMSVATMINMPKSLGDLLLKPINFIYSGKNRIDNLAYGDDPDMKYDEYPSNEISAPIIIFWHGGSWKTGDKSMYRFVGSKLQSMGAHAFVIDYPKFPKQTYPGFIDDAKQCVQTISNKYPGRQIIVMGHSAGANTAMLVAIEYQHVIAKAISISGVCTLSARHWRPVFGTAIDDKSYDPRRHIKEADKLTKFLLIHGIIDYIVPVSDSISLNRMLQKADLSSKLLLLKTADHILILPTILIGPRFLTRSRLKQFIRS